MSARRRQSWSITLGLGFLLFHFQNCGSPSTQEQLNSLDGGEVRIIDDWRSKPLQFTEDLVQLRDGVELLGAQGLCLRKESRPLHWKLIDRDSQNVREGVVACELGGFQIELANLTELQCGQEYQLQIQNEDQAGAELALLIKCPALASEEIKFERPFFEQNSRQSGEPTNSSMTCFKEIERADFNDVPRCQRVCYIGDRLSERELLEIGECSSLFPSVAKAFGDSSFSEM